MTATGFASWLNLPTTLAIGLMTLFLGTGLDPSIAGRGEGSPLARAASFAESDAYASSGRARSKRERATPQPTARRLPWRTPSFNAGAWGAGFGGSQTTLFTASLVTTIAISRTALDLFG